MCENPRGVYANPTLSFREEVGLGDRVGQFYFVRQDMLK